jgi:hypothetical protein
VVSKFPVLRERVKIKKTEKESVSMIFIFSGLIEQQIKEVNGIMS